MRRALLAGLVALAGVLGLGVVGQGVAHADTLTTAGYYTAYLDHLGNQANGRVKFEAWIVQLRDSSGVVYGTVGRTRATDITGGVTAIQVNRSATKARSAGDVSIQRDDTPVHQDTPGTQIYVQADSNDSIGDGAHWWATTLGDPSAAGILGYDSNISVRWADGTLGTYALGSADVFYYRCSNASTLGACSSAYQIQGV